MKCISLPFRLSDSYNFPASLTSKFRKMVHNGSFLKLYIPTTLKFDRKAEIPPLAKHGSQKWQKAKQSAKKLFRNTTISDCGRLPEKFLHR